MVDLLLENDSIVEALQTAVHRGGFGLSAVPALVKRVIAEDRWQERFVRASQRPVAFARFVDFLGAQPPNGLGADLPMVKRLCADDPEAMDLIDRATVGRHGGDHKSGRIKGLIQPLDGGGRDRSEKPRRRLRKDFPDEYETVLSGDVPVYRAAIEAGVYPRRISVSLQSAESAARTILRHADPGFVRSLVAYLVDEEGR